MLSTGSRIETCNPGERVYTLGESDATVSNNSLIRLFLKNNNNKKSPTILHGFDIAKKNTVFHGLT